MLAHFWKGVFGLVFGLAMLPTARAERLVRVAGGGDGTDGNLAVQARLQAPFGVSADRSGNLFIVEMMGQRVRKVDSQGRLSTVAGTGQTGSGGDGGLALNAQFNGMHSLAVAANGDLYLADTWNNRVRKIDRQTGRISTIAGTGHKGFGGDGGPATQAQFGNVYCVVLDSEEKVLYLADLDNYRIRTVNLQTGLVQTVVGNGTRGKPEDGAEARQCRWWIRVPSRWMRRGISTSWSAAGTRCGWSIGAAESARWSEREGQGTAATVATGGRPA